MLLLQHRDRRMIDIILKVLKPKYVCILNGSGICNTYYVFTLFTITAFLFVWGFFR